MSKAIAFLILLLVSPAVHAAQHIVGGSTGWTQSISTSGWATGQTFIVGDTLLFNYGSDHAVDVVSSEDFANCNGASPIESFSSGLTTITLNTTGPWYFLCPRPGHCAQGMQLSINVIESGSVAPTGSVPATPPGTPATPGTPPGTPGTPPPPPAASGADSMGRGGLMWVVLMGMVGVMG